MTIDALFEQLKHPNPHLRERAMGQIAETRDENTIPRLMSILGEQDVNYRRSAVKALGIIGANSVPSLVETLESSDNTVVRASCVKALAQVAFNHPDEAFPQIGMDGLKKALNDSNPVVHIAAVMALGEIGPAVLDILVETLKTTDNVAVAVAITNALGSMGDSKAAEVLKEFANDENADSYVRESAVSALSRLEMVIQYKGTGNKGTSQE